MTQGLVKRAMWKVAHKLGGSARRWAWNNQFAGDRWTYLGEQRSEGFSKAIAALANGGPVVDCGAGECWLFDSLLKQSPSIGSYEAFDISQIAVSHAAERHEDTTIPHRLYVDDLETWAGTDNAAVIVAEESINYISISASLKFVSTALQSLSESGVLVITTHDPEKHRTVLEEIQRNHNFVFRRMNGTRCFLFVANDAETIRHAEKVVEANLDKHSA